MPVLALDGEALGTVKEVHPDYFKVDAPHRRDYWLRRLYVLAGDQPEARLVLPRQSVAKYRVRRPQLATVTPVPATPELQVADTQIS
jgi:hypothetical protein